MKPGLEATERPTLRDIAWAAGVYEGEGNVGMSGSLCVTQRDRWLLERLKALFGGSISAKTNPQPFHRWHIGGPRARGFALTVFAFLSPRRRQQILENLFRPVPNVRLGRRDTRAVANKH